ncbi:MAG: GNAT family N-acetyltransferase [Candidatus Thiodiazotropha sp. (ex Codakia orbicularis)]|nr:GNAT family N-acetyltransferase [Candidatus Thiodiazotropha sp. (ex Codakia orbicularis)]
MDKEEYRYSTDRLLVSEWHSIAPNEWNQVGLDAVVLNTLTPRVTQSLPPVWQGAYTLERANHWINERDKEGVTLIVVDKSSLDAIGFVILFESSNYKDLRLGYLLKESAWGKGFASELIQGLVEWSTNKGISSITGGVDVDNIASKRVLEKNGFINESDINGSEEHMYVWRNRHNK